MQFLKVCQIAERCGQSRQLIIIYSKFFEIGQVSDSLREDCEVIIGDIEIRQVAQILQRCWQSRQVCVTDIEKSQIRQIAEGLRQNSQLIVAQIERMKLC